MLSHIFKRLLGLNLWLGRMVSWLVLLALFFVLATVILRYFLANWLPNTDALLTYFFAPMAKPGFSATSLVLLPELALFFHAAVFLLGSAFTLQQDGHVRIDIFYGRLSPRGKALVNALGSFCFLLPVAFILLYFSLPYALHSWSFREGSQESGGFPWLFLSKSLLPLMAFLLLYQGVLQGLRDALFFIRPAWFGKDILYADNQVQS
jgi:TRAP-type mannitol/chloroaromatic compound transport system permease small subunit